MTQLYAHQSAAIQKFQDKPFGAILFECGLGKTRTALELCAKRGFRRVLVLCPVSVKSSWQEEIEKSALLVKCVDVDGTPAKKKALLNEKATVTLLSYDSVPTLVPDLLKQGYDCLIADESTKLKGFRTLRTRSVLKLAKTIPHRFILTGTPVTEHAHDLWPQFYFLSPFILGSSFVAFRNMYCLMGGFKCKQIVGFKNLDHLISKIHPHSARATKEECLDLPDKIYETRQLPMSPEQKKLIKEVKALNAASDYANVAGTLTVIQRITSGYDPINNKPLESHPKKTMLEDVLDEGLPTPMIIWVRFLEDVKLVTRILEARGMSVRQMIGETPTHERAQTIKDFQAGQVQALVATNVGGYGLNLQGLCASVIFYSLWWSFESRIQAEDRVHRIGTTKAVTYIDLLCKGSVDKKIHTALKKKRNFSDYVMENLQDALKDEEGEE